MARKLKPTYKTLLKIKKPVLIVLYAQNDRIDTMIFDRVRILHPDGKCEFVHEFWGDKFIKSCNSTNHLSLSVEKMKSYDYGILKIKEIIEL